MEQGSAADGICAGLNVLELGSGSAAASIAGVVLADAGARVIKIEPPDGDRLRTENPSGFLVWNRGKDSLVADLRTTDGQDLLRELVLSADVVIEGFAPGTTDAWGVGPDALRALNPALIHCSITGFGNTGAYSASKAMTRWWRPRSDCGPGAVGATATVPSCSPCRGPATAPECNPSQVFSAPCWHVRRPAAVNNWMPPWWPGSIRSTTSSRRSCS